MTAIEATNRGTSNLPWAMPALRDPAPLIDVADLSREAGEALVLDVREPSEYRTGHIPGACNVPTGDLATRIHEIPRDRQIVVACEGGIRSRRAAQFLTQVGLERVADLKGGTAAWQQAGFPMARTIWWREGLMVLVEALQQMRSSWRAG